MHQASIFCQKIYLNTNNYSCRPHKRKTGLFTSWIERQRLRNVQNSRSKRAKLLFYILNVQSCDVLVVFVVLVAQAPKFICLAIESGKVKGDKASSTEIDLLGASVPLAIENRFNLNCNKYCNNGRVSDILLCQNQIVALLLLSKARR